MNQEERLTPRSTKATVIPPSQRSFRAKRAASLESTRHGHSRVGISEQDPKACLDNVEVQEVTERFESAC